ncbi:hypothetical protein XELAEV_18017539mg [Xenopus laevis]|uniref:YEATS domain-containing protein 4 n=1 Tax=Xenopus laevis TaxID=8355 RepID=A0A974HSN9_XENLA|nr:hypothetical protein XELAEV_18017539mg [Xenopus laevis]
MDFPVVVPFTKWMKVASSDCAPSKTLPKITRKMPASKCSSRMQPGTAEPASSITANRDIVHPAMFFARLKTCTVFFHEPLLSTGVYNEKHHYFSLLNENVQRASVKTTPDDLASLGVTIVKPIVYGNVARYFGKKREEDGHTHQWTVYVKPYRNEDMSAYVKKIQFKLHESYGNPLRVVTKPPYEITETGWGEFEIIIKIFFIDPNERPVTLYHLLKLFQSDTNAMLGKKTVVSEFYDEMIFQDPTAMMQQLLTTSRQLTLGAYKHETEFSEFESKTKEKMEGAKKKTSFEISDLKERLKASRETINCLKNEIKKLEEDDPTKDI